MTRILISALVLVVIVVGAALGYVVTRDPNTFKPELETLIRDNTGLEPKLGALDWRLWPPLAIEVRDVSAAYPDRPQLVNIERLAFNVRIWPLLSTSPSIEVASVAIEGVDANLVRDARGVANWEAPASATPAPSPTPTPTPTPAPAPTSVESVALLPFAVDAFSANGKARYRDAVAGTDYTVSAFATDINDAGLERSFPVQLDISVSDATGLDTTTALTVDVTIPASGAVVQLAGLRASGSVRLSAAADAGAYRLNIDAATYTLATGNFDAPALSGVLAGADISGSAHLDGNSGATSGQLTGTTTQVVALLAMLMNPATLPLPNRLQVGTHYVLGPDSLTLDTLSLNADDQEITGKLTARYPENAPVSVSFDLNAKTLNLDPYLNTTSGSVGAAAPAAADPDSLLPLDTLATTYWDGRANIGQLQAMNLVFSNATLQTKNTGKKLDLAVAGNLLGGSVNATVDTTLDDTPGWNIRLTTRDVQGGPLVDQFAPGWEFDGLMQLDANLQARGNTLAALEKSVRGPISFDGGKGKLNVSGLKAQAVTIATLAGRAESAAKWPDVLDYGRFTATIEMLSGLGQQRFDAKLDNLIIAGTGGYALAGNNVAYDATITVEADPAYHTFDLNEYLVGIPFPIRCEGSLDGTARLCGLNANGVQQVIAKALSGAAGDKVRERLGETIDEKVPEQYRDAARGFLDLLGRGKSK